MQYISMQTFLGALYRSIGFSVEPADAIEWTVECLRLINPAPAYEEHVAFQLVQDHKAPLPPDLLAIQQIARNTCWTQGSVGTACANYVSQSICETEVGECPAPVITDCNGDILNERCYFDFRPFIDAQFRYYAWMSSSLYRTCYTPVRPSTHTFFSVNGCKNCPPQLSYEQLYYNVKDEYKVDKPYLIFSFKEGWVAVSYRRLKRGDDGMPMVPDESAWTNASIAYIRLKKAQILYDLQQSSSALNYLQNAEMKWEQASAHAGATAMLHKGLGEVENSIRQNDYILYPVDNEGSFYGNLGEPEVRRWYNN